ncbi:hypothetical protein K8I85_16790 [bacterium]|nr:hypothetical protein [bacterium]
MNRHVSLMVLCGLVAVATARAETPVLQPYGFVRLDGIVNDSPMNHPQYAMWVAGEVDAPSSASTVAKDKGELGIHPRLSRVGVNIGKVSAGNGVTVAGKVEVDFQNGGSESREALRMRHAYLTIARGSWEILAGQTWDLVSPLFPYVNHDGMMWNSGNTGDRRPQARFTAKSPVGDGSARFAVAVAMPNAINNRDMDGNGVRDGAYAMLPAVQGLAEVKLASVTAGVSGHFHRDRVVTSSVGGLGETDFDAKMIAGHLQVSIGGAVTVAGEAFAGENLDDLRGGIGQGINSGAGKSIGTVGGWGELRLKASPHWTVAAGGSMDDPDDADVSSGMRTRNTAFYGAARLAALDGVQVGLEFIHWQTDYVGGPDGDANRVDLWASRSF